jgi:hypothetical protein
LCTPLLARAEAARFGQFETELNTLNTLRTTHMERERENVVFPSAWAPQRTRKL